MRRIRSSKYGPATSAGASEHLPARNKWSRFTSDVEDDDKPGPASPRRPPSFSRARPTQCRSTPRRLSDCIATYSRGHRFRPSLTDDTQNTSAIFSRASRSTIGSPLTSRHTRQSSPCLARIRSHRIIESRRVRSQSSSRSNDDNAYCTSTTRTSSWYRAQIRGFFFFFFSSGSSSLSASSSSWSFFPCFSSSLAAPPSSSSSSRGASTASPKGEKTPSRRRLRRTLRLLRLPSRRTSRPPAGRSFLSSVWWWELSWRRRPRWRRLCSSFCSGALVT
mmetsp:Transcript_26580/g.85983  ORF Transcript_26580/g.85983 Transcript_26580/m.85983 type:complete len:277 (-) Transcript_26580:1356-2186(-)